MIPLISSYGVVQSGLAELYEANSSGVGGLSSGIWQWSTARKIGRLEFVYYIEQKSELERNFMLKLYDNPNDLATRLVYADWLEENGRAETAKHVRNGWTFGVA